MSCGTSAAYGGQQREGQSAWGEDEYDKAEFTDSGLKQRGSEDDSDEDTKSGEGYSPFEGGHDIAAVRPGIWNFGEEPVGQHSFPAVG